MPSNTGKPLHASRSRPISSMPRTNASEDSGVCTLGTKRPVSASLLPNSGTPPARYKAITSGNAGMTRERASYYTKRSRRHQIVVPHEQAILAASDLDQSAQVSVVAEVFLVLEVAKQTGTAFGILLDYRGDLGASGRAVLAH